MKAAATASTQLWNRSGPTPTVCPWKGTASYHTITVDDEVGENAAWTYPEPKDAAANTPDHVAFYPVVQIVD